MPDKRQESKQRRAARNRANREALAARRENAVITGAPPAQAADHPPRARTGLLGGLVRGAAPGGATASSGSRASAAGGSPAPTRAAVQTTGRRPGEIALWIAFAFAILGMLAMLFLLKAPVDDRGEPIPGGPDAYGGLTVAAREAVTGEPIPDKSITYLEAYGLQAVVSAALPVSLTAFAVWASRRRPDRSRMLTYAMLGMAVAIFLGGGLFVFFPALIFMAIGGFMARRADMPARVAERATGGGGFFGRGRGAVIDAESEEVVDDPGVADEPAGSGGDAAAAPQDETAAPRPASRSRRARRGAATAGSSEAPVESVTPDSDSDAGTSGADPSGAADGATGAEADPLAELEAELEAEHAAEAAAAAEQDGDEPGGNGSRRGR